jgi:uncharacterized protein
MLSVDLRSLEGHAVSIDGALAPEDPVWQDGDTLPSAPIEVHGRISGAGGGRFYFTGHLEGTAVAECRRCLTDVSVTAADDLAVLFVEAGDDEGLEDDPDVFMLDPKARDVDLRPAVREAWLLAVPAYALCRDDCRGLCPTCGVDRNTTACECALTADSAVAGA